MRLIIDTNVLLTYFWKDSVFRGVCEGEKAELFAPELVVKEFREHAPQIAERAGVPKEEFQRVCKEALLQLVIIDFRDYEEFLKECQSSIGELDGREYTEVLEDLDFLAVAKMLCCALWSSDKLLRKQKAVTVLDTKEVVSLLDID